MEHIPIVIDNGTGFTKAGYAGMEKPKIIFPTMIGLPKSTVVNIGGQNKDFFVGIEAYEKKDLVTFKPPIENGNIISWDDIERLWHHTLYQELSIMQGQHPVIMSDKWDCPWSSREKALQIMFETFDVPGYYSGNQAVFGLFSVGRTNGIVWDAGEGKSSVVPIYEGYMLPHAVQVSDISGDLLTQNVLKKLAEKNIDTSVFKPNDIAGIKEATCQVTPKIIPEPSQPKKKGDKKSNKKAEAKKAAENQRPAAIRQINKNADFDTPEIIFNPSIINLSIPSVPATICQSLMLVDRAVRKEMLQSIVLLGGSSMFKGLPQRMEAEIRSFDITNIIPKEEYKFAPPRIETDSDEEEDHGIYLDAGVIATPERKHAVWMGGSVFGSLDQFPLMMVTKEEFKEVGPAIVQMKCYS